MNTEKISLIIGGVFLAILAGVGIQASSYVLSDKFKENPEVIATADLDFTKMQQSNVLEDDGLDIVVENKISEINFSQLETNLSHLVLLDKILLGYYLSYNSPSGEALLLSIKADIKYPEDSVEVLSFSEGKKYYERLKDGHKAKIVSEQDQKLIDPNANSNILEDYFNYADFVFENPENLEKVLLGLNAYLDLIANPNPTDEMLQNPDPNMCMIARIHPDTRMLPEELECDF